MTTPYLVIATLGLGALVAACEPAATKGVTSAMPEPETMSVSTAAGVLAEASCEHESSCEGIGPSRHYPTVAACAEDFGQTAQNDFERHPCRAGINARHLEACADMLRDESCHPLSTLSRMHACRLAAICNRPPAAR